MGLGAGKLRSAALIDLISVLNPINSFAWALSDTTSKPPTWMYPLDGRIMVAIILRIVVFPAPSEPTRPKMLPAGTWMEIPETASTVPKCFETFST